MIIVRDFINAGNFKTVRIKGNQMNNEKILISVYIDEP
jgi:hypothetical protein